MLRTRISRWICLAVLVLLMGSCGSPGSAPVIDSLGSVGGRGPTGAFVAASVSALADQVAAGGPDRRPPDPELAAKIRAVDPETGFVYGFRYDGCAQDNPRLTVQSRDSLVAAVDDLNRQCIRAMPQTIYFRVSWDGLDDSFTIDGPGRTGRTQIHDRVVG